MQESKDDKDEELCKKVNDTVRLSSEEMTREKTTFSFKLNNPPSPGFGDDAGGAGGMGGGAHPLQSLMERMTGGGPGGLDPSDLSNVLRGKEVSIVAVLVSQTLYVI
jgi:hypothetical protein